MQHKSENKYYTVWAKSEKATQGAVSLLIVTFNIWFLSVLLFGGFYVSYKWFWNTSIRAIMYVFHGYMML